MFGARPQPFAIALNVPEMQDGIASGVNILPSIASAAVAAARDASCRMLRKGRDVQTKKDINIYKHICSTLFYFTTPFSGGGGGRTVHKIKAAVLHVVAI